MFTTGDTVGLAEWIIDDTYLVLTCNCKFPLYCAVPLEEDLR